MSIDIKPKTKWTLKKTFHLLKSEPKNLYKNHILVDHVTDSLYIHIVIFLLTSSRNVTCWLKYYKNLSLDTKISSHWERRVIFFSTQMLKPQPLFLSSNVWSIFQLYLAWPIVAQSYQLVTKNVLETEWSVNQWISIYKWIRLVDIRSTNNHLSHYPFEIKD